MTEKEFQQEKKRTLDIMAGQMVILDKRILFGYKSIFEKDPLKRAYYEKRWEEAGWELAEYIQNNPI